MRVITDKCPLGTPGFWITQSSRCAPPSAASPTAAPPGAASLLAPLEGEIPYEGMPRGALPAAAGRRSRIARGAQGGTLLCQVLPLAGDAAVAEH